MSGTDKSKHLTHGLRVLRETGFGTSVFAVRREIRFVRVRTTTGWKPVAQGNSRRSRGALSSQREERDAYREHHRHARFRYGADGVVAERDRDAVLLLRAGPRAQRVELAEAFRGRGAVVGPTLGWAQVPEAVRLAEVTGTLAGPRPGPVFADDHFALMDHLGFGKFHVLGGCIGGSYCFEAIEQAPDRVAAAVLQNPIGLWENRENWDAAVKGYGETVRKRDPSISQGTIDSFGKNMFGGDFVFSVTRDFVKACRTPLYLQPGTDKPHPAHTSAEIAELAPNIEVQKDWRGPEFLQESIRRVHAFLAKNTPAS